LSRTMIGAGVPAGAKSPNHATTSKPGSVSETAGRSGNAGERFRLVTARPRILPERIWFAAPGRF